MWGLRTPVIVYNVAIVNDSHFLNKVVSLKILIERVPFFQELWLSALSDHPFSTCVNFYEKLIFLIPICTRMRAHQRLRIVSFSKNFVYVADE